MQYVSVWHHLFLRCCRPTFQEARSGGGSMARALLHYLAAVVRSCSSPSVCMCVCVCGRVCVFSRVIMENISEF